MQTMANNKSYNPCDDCQYSYSKNNQESKMCKICEFKQLLDKPTADVVEVVYCKDCVCFKQSISALFPETNCFICDNPYGLKRNIKETDYCSYGERRCDNDS